MRSAFTIIEIFVSVMIISIVVLGIAKIEERNIAMARYIGYRGANELSNTLFFSLSKDIDKKNDTINAYEAIKKVMHIKRDDMKEILQNIERNVTISDTIPLREEELPVSIEVRALMLKSEYPSRYYIIDIGRAKSADSEAEDPIQ